MAESGWNPALYVSISRVTSTAPHSLLPQESAGTPDCFQASRSFVYCQCSQHTLWQGLGNWKWGEIIHLWKNFQHHAGEAVSPDACSCPRKPARDHKCLPLQSPWHSDPWPRARKARTNSRTTPKNAGMRQTPERQEGEGSDQRPLTITNAFLRAFPAVGCSSRVPVLVTWTDSVGPALGGEPAPVGMARVLGAV